MSSGSTYIMGSMHANNYCYLQLLLVYIYSQAAKEAKEAEEAKERLGLGESTDSLKALIQKNKASREMQMDSFLSDLEAKYGQPKKGKTTDNKTSSSTKTKKTKR